MVEGRDAEGLFVALLAHLGNPNIQVQSFGGVDELRPFLKALTLTPGFEATVESVGVVRDAEAGAAGAADSVRGALAAAGLPVPAASLVLEQVAGKPRTAFLILPHGVAQGMLEDVCLASVAGDPAIQCVDAYIACLQQQQIIPGNIPKARLHTFLSSRAGPGKRLGEAAHAGYWVWNDVIFDPLKQLVQLI